MNARVWLVAWVLALLVAVALLVRGVLALAPGGSGAGLCIGAAVVIIGFTAWAYMHREEAQR